MARLTPSILASNQDIKGLSVVYFGWTEDTEAKTRIEQHKSAHPGASIALVGHSYGGDTAYDVAKALSSIDVSLFTLDPVSNFRPDQLPKPDNVSPWFNVWVSGGSSFGDAISVLGGDWRHQDAAQNKHHPDVNHDDAVTMFNRIQPELREQLQKNAC